jgi:hypothetical protein
VKQGTALKFYKHPHTFPGTLASAAAAQCAVKACISEGHQYMLLEVGLTDATKPIIQNTTKKSFSI